MIHFCFKHKIWLTSVFSAYYFRKKTTYYVNFSEIMLKISKLYDIIIMCAIKSSPKLY